MATGNLIVEIGGVVIRQANSSTIYHVCCPECDWIGMSDDCSWGRCPYCYARVKREEDKNGTVEN